ncbi:MAG: hypothetical protein EOO28_03265 [Comamonadaceae bacterium]|nr:MAG: hypothetical protein EOO28_03265 [Comamonadaceae bacterium]
MSPASLLTALLTFVAWAVLAPLSGLLNNYTPVTQTDSVLLTSGLIFGLLVAVRPVKHTVVLVTSVLAAITFNLLDGERVLLSLGLGFSEVAAAGLGALVARAFRYNGRFPAHDDAGDDSKGGALGNGSSGQDASTPMDLQLHPFGRPGRAFAGLVLGALVTAIVGASLAMALWSRLLPEATHLAREWRSWTFSSFVSIMLLAPVVISFAGFRVKRSGGMGMAQFTAGMLSFVLFLLVGALVFSEGVADRFGETLGPTLTYLPVPFLVITAILWKERGATLATLFGGLAVIAWTTSGAGPFPELESFPGESVLEVQFYVAVMAVLVGAVSALGSTAEHALVHAQAWRTRYRQLLDSSRIVVASFDPATGAAQWGEGASELLHANPATLLTVQDLVACASPSEQPALLAAWAAVTGGENTSVPWTAALDWPDGSRSQMTARLSAVRGVNGELEEIAAVLRFEDLNAA